MELEAFEVFIDYFKRATGIDPEDTTIAWVMPEKISISRAWHDECLEAALDGVERCAELRAILALLLLTRAPKVLESQQEKVIIEEGAIVFYAS